MPSDLYPDFDKIKAIYLLDYLHISPVKITEWIVTGSLKIIGFLGPDKNNPKIKTANDLDKAQFNEVADKLVRELQLALWAWRNEAEGPGGTDLEKLEDIERQISDDLRFLVFDRSDVEKLINETPPPKTTPDEDSDSMVLRNHDGQSSATNAILSYAKKRSQEGDPLVAANFSDNTANETILAICEEFNVLPDSLRKIVQKENLLKPSKSGRKPTA